VVTIGWECAQVCKSLVFVTLDDVKALETTSQYDKTRRESDIDYERIEEMTHLLNNSNKNGFKSMIK